jgi:uncharacterized protein (DUF1330 family)
MSAYAVAHIQSITVGPPIIEYLERIDATLTPYRGRFLIHGDPADVREGDFAGNLIVIEFPGHDAAVGWYDSAAYREILPLRTGSSDGWVILIKAFPPIIMPPTSSAPRPRSAANRRNRQPACHVSAARCVDLPPRHRLSRHGAPRISRPFGCSPKQVGPRPLFRVAG